MDRQHFIKHRLEQLRTARSEPMTAIINNLKMNRYTLDKLFRGEVQSLRDKAMLRSLIEYFGLTEDQFFNRESPQPLAVKSPAAPTHKIPLYGEIPAGSPIPVEGSAEPEEWIDAPPGLKTRNAFALRVRGQSMCPRFLPGDIVFFEPLDIRLGVKDPKNPVPLLTFERLNGRVVAALVENEATLKQLKIVGGGDSYELELKPFNPEYTPLRIKPEHTVLFQGVAVKLVRDENGFL